MSVYGTLQYLHISRNQAATWERNDEGIHIMSGWISGPFKTTTIYEVPG